MSLINVSNLTFGYDGENIFDNVSFQLDTDWKLGFTGRNGRGKTTFLNLLMGKYEYSGRITANVSFEYSPYGVNDMNAFVIDIIRDICFDSPDWKIRREVSLLNMADDVLYRQFSTLSSGERTKALLAALFLKENSFLLIDEPTNHLDASARRSLSNYLSKKRGFILVSHDRAFLDGCVDHILSINRTDIDIQRGNFSSWLANKELRDSSELAENERLKKDIKRLNAAAERTSRWSDKVEKAKFVAKDGVKPPDRGYIGHKSAKMALRSKTLENRLLDAAEKKLSLLHNIETADSLKLSPLKFHSSRLIELKDVSVIYGMRIVCSHVSFTVDQGERVSLSGKNGCGKSSILKLILGDDILYSGQLIKNPSLKISYVPQSTDFLRGSLDEYADSLGIDISLFKAILRKLDFSREQFGRRMEDFSEGQKKKVLISASLCEKAHLYIWDEPLNYIDIISRMQIERLIKEYSPTLLFVEHDLAFAESMADKTVYL